MNTDRYSFYEVQYFRQRWFLLISLAIAGLIWYGFLLQIVFRIPFGTNPAPDWFLWIFWLVFGIGLPVLVYITKLITAVNKENVFIRFVPFTSKEIPYSQIDHVEARTYKPIKEFGGWGIRWGSGKRKAYNISGDTGVELTL